MNTLIIKLNATGDVVRTTTLLRRLPGQITWITAPNNTVLLQGLANVRCVSWEERQAVVDRRYDLLINLEDEEPIAGFANTVPHEQRFGAYLTEAGQMQYTDTARGWFDLSLISVYGREKADQLKLKNRRTYQDLIFEGLGFQFSGERYVLPEPVITDLAGDVAIAPVAGPVWPMKNWSYYKELKQGLEGQGLRVNILPRRNSLREHLGDVKNHRCLVGGDSLPMHLALGVGTPCVTLFTCTSPWEIHDYGIQRQIVSPLLGEFFYKRGFDERATKAITLAEVLATVVTTLFGPAAAAMTPETPKEEGWFSGLKNRLLQSLAMSLPGGSRLRVALHRLRGVQIGGGVWIGHQVLIETAHPEYVSIGDRVIVGMRSTIVAHFQEQNGVRIKDDVYIGACAVILPGVTIGAGAVISAGSVVSTSVPPQTVVQGNPAQRIARCGIPLGLNTSRAEFIRHLKKLDGPPAG